MTYGQSNPTLTFSYLLNGQMYMTAPYGTSVTGSPSLSLSTTITPNSSRGSYPNAILASVGTLEANNNYTFSYGFGELTINPKALTYTGLYVSTSKVYDDSKKTGTVSGSAQLQTPEAAGTGTPNDGRPYIGDSVSLLLGTLTASYNSADVLTANLVTFGGLSLTGSTNGNYTLTPLTQAATITPKPVAVQFTAIIRSTTAPPQPRSAAKRSQDLSALIRSVWRLV